MRIRAVVIAVVAAITAGCTGSSDDSSPPDTGPVGTAGTTATEPGSVQVPTGPGAPIVDGVANGLILVHDREGGTDALATYQDDGTKVAGYARGAGEVIWQPIWSPDGRRIAWTRSEDGATWELVTAAVDGTDRTTHLLPGRPDYITYDPTASRVLALTPSPEGFGLVIVQVGEPADGDAALALVDVGAPYFSDFSPDGDRVVAHVGGDLRVVGVDGDRQPLGLSSVRHQTPAWHPTEQLVFVATDEIGGNRLVSYDVTSGATVELATFDAFVAFDLDPTGSLLAVSAFAPDDGDGALLALRSAESREDAPRLDGGLWIVDVAGGAPRQLDLRAPSAPMWDPTGSRVLARTSVDGPGTWNVYELDGTRSATTDLTIEDSLMPLYLPFWDQYVRSQTLWSPDGGRFVHVGRDDEGLSGVWVHDAATTGPSTYLTSGDLAFWSPT